MGRSFVLQRHAAELILHGQLLALAGSEGIRAVLVDADSPDVRRGVAAELAVCQRHVRTVVIETVIHGGQGLAVGGIEDHHGIAIPEICRRDDPALPLRRRGFQLVERRGILIGIPIITEPSATDIILQCSTITDNADRTRIHADCIHSLGRSAIQHIRSRFTRNILSTGRLDGIAVFHLFNSKGILRIIADDLRISNRYVNRVILCIQCVERTIQNQLSGLIHDQIRARPILRCFRDLHIGLLRRLRCEDRGGQQGQSHHQGHQQRT